MTEYKKLTDEELKNKTNEFKEQLGRNRDYRLSDGKI